MSSDTSATTPATTKNDTPAPHVEPGLYRHYKNKPYRVLGTALHSETLEPLVVYEALYENKLGTLWVRPAAMFAETITLDGKLIPRFERIGD